MASCILFIIVFYLVCRPSKQELFHLVDCRDLAYILAGEGPSLLNRDTMYCKKNWCVPAVSSLRVLSCLLKHADYRAQPTPTYSSLHLYCHRLLHFYLDMLSEKSQDLPVFTKVQFSNFNVVIDVNELFSYFEILYSKFPLPLVSSKNLHWQPFELTLSAD